jgi:hypothetical protein
VTAHGCATQECRYVASSFFYGSILNVYNTYRERSTPCPNRYPILNISAPNW